jgi:hypothetical protein
MIDTTIQLGEPVEHRGVVIAPLFPRRRPRARYVTLEEALPLGFQVTEVDAAGSVPELLALNPLDTDVLLYDGEELLGAKQNRILNVSVLVPARGETRIPVSCVEAGRWHARSATFAAAPHTAYPELRRRKAERLSAEPLALGVAQADVWQAVAAKAGRHGVHSPTSAQADIFEARARDRDSLRTAFPLAAGQCGALLALGGERLCLDHVSRPDAFARLYPKLLEGYLLDASERLDGTPAGAESLDSFLRGLDSAVRSTRPSAGRGDDVRLRGKRVVGSGLEADGELIQLCAFSSESDGAAPTRIARPSLRACGVREELASGELLARQRGLALLDLVDLVGDEAVRLAMDAVRGLGVGRLDEAEDPAGLLVDPVALVVDAVLALRLDVLHVRVGHVRGRDPSLDLVHVHEERHSSLLVDRFARSYATGACGTATSCVK